MNPPFLPGYWRAMAAGWNPNPPGSSNHPDPPGSAGNPNPPGSAGHPNPPNSAGNPNPPWASGPAGAGRGGDAALLAEALRTTRSRIVRPPAARAAPLTQGTLGVGNGPALWRWQRPFREAAILTELMGIFAVDGLTLFWLPGIADLNADKKPAALFELVGPDKDFDWNIQIDKVLRAAVEREDRAAEVLSQQFDFSPFFDALTGIDQASTKNLSELLTVSANLATQVVMALKNTAAVWRPFQINAAIQPMIATPGHGSLPSGHATVAAMNALLLSALLYQPDDERIQHLDRLARRIAFNRVVAGVHFPVDSLVGYTLGRQLAEGLLAAAGVRPRPEARNFAVGPQDAQLREIDPLPPRTDVAEGAEVDKSRAPLFRLLWEATECEVKQLRI